MQYYSRMSPVVFINGLFLVNDLIFQLEFAISDELGYTAVLQTHYYNRLPSYKNLRNIATCNILNYLSQVFS